VIVVDTNVLVYAVGSEHPLRDPCRRLVDAIGDGQIDATTSVEVVQEYLHVRSRRVSRTDAIEQARQTVHLLRPLLQATEDDLSAGLDLFGEHAVGAFDAVLAATAMREGATLVSADTVFAAVDGLRHLDPGSPSFLDDLGVG
jgi:predicted nucleic acid-binding protein